jgi:hypothetical protein
MSQSTKRSPKKTTIKQKIVPEEDAEKYTNEELLARYIIKATKQNIGGEDKYQLNLSGWQLNQINYAIMKAKAVLDVQKNYNAKKRKETAATTDIREYHTSVRPEIIIKIEEVITDTPITSTNNNNNNNNDDNNNNNEQ